MKGITKDRRRRQCKKIISLHLRPWRGGELQFLKRPNIEEAAYHCSVAVLKNQTQPY